MNESLNERYSFPEVDDAIEHFRNDVGIEPDVDDVVGFIERNYPDMVPEDMKSYNKWYSEIAAEISPRLNENAESSPEYHFYEYDGSVNFKDGSFEKFKEKTTAKSPEQALNFIKAKFCEKKYGKVIKPKMSQFTLDKSSLKEIDNDSIEDEEQLSIFDIMGK